MYRKINDRKLFGRMSNPTHAAYLFRWRIFTTHATFIVLLSFLLDETSLANDFAVVRLETKEGLFITGIFPARNLFFITVLNKFQKLAAGENYRRYSFILIPKQ